MNDVLYTAIENGDFNEVKLLLSIKKYNIHDKNKDGNSCILIASKYGHTNIIELLYLYGAKINDRGIGWHSSIYIASNNGNLSVIKTLLAKGANIDDRAYLDYDTCLMVACKKCHFNVVEFLLSNGANINCLDRNNKSVIFYASIGGDIKILNILLEYGVKLDYVDYFGDNALIYATKYGNTNFIEALIRNGLNINFKTANCMTPIMIAAEKGYIDVVKLLLFYEADILYINKYQDSFNSLLIKNNHTNIIDFLKIWPTIMYIIVNEELLLYNELFASAIDYEEYK
jgi:ankyrin repeat protein